MKRLFLAVFAAMALTSAALAELVIEPNAKPADSSAAETFRVGYLQGSGLTYVRMPDAGKMTLYRFGNASRNGVAIQTGASVTYWLHSCWSPRLIVLPDDAAQVPAEVQFIRPGESGYDEAEAEYQSGCYNPWVRGRTYIDRLITHPKE
jgi:hypothetical protein